MSSTGTDEFDLCEKMSDFSTSSSDDYVRVNIHSEASTSTAVPNLEPNETANEEIQQQATSITKEEPLTLLTLPRAIRDKIFDLVLAPTGFILLDPVKADGDNTWDFGDGTPEDARLFTVAVGGGSREFAEGEDVILGAIRTCKQIYDETKHVFFEKNTIFIQWMAPKYVHPALVRQLKHIRVRIDPPGCARDNDVEAWRRKAVYIQTIGATIQRFEESGMDVKSFSLLIGETDMKFDHMRKLLVFLDSPEFLMFIARMVLCSQMFMKSERSIILGGALENPEMQWLQDKASIVNADGLIELEMHVKALSTVFLDALEGIVAKLHSKSTPSSFYQDRSR